MNIRKSIPLLLILGSLIFLAASFSPISAVYTAPTPAARLEIITQAGPVWFLTQVVYAAGALLTALAAVAAIYALPRRSFLALLLAVPAFLGGAFFFTYYAISRGLEPQAWVFIPFPHPPFLVYTLLTQAGLFIFGLTLLQSQISTRLSWLLMGSALGLFILTLIFRDMPPMGYYLLTLAAGIVLFRRARASVPGLPEAA